MTFLTRIPPFFLIVNPFKGGDYGFMKRLLPYFLLCIMFYFFTFPSEVSAAAKDGLTLWFTSVVPALLPFFILSNLCMDYGVPEILGKFCRPFTERLLRLPGESAFVIITGYSTGAPVSAGLIATLRKKGQLTKRQAEDMLGFCTNVSPLFILSVVAVSFLGHPETGIQLGIIHYGSNFLLGLAVGFTRKKIPINKAKLSQSRSWPPLGKALSDAVYHGVSTINLIGGLMVVFIILLHILDNLGITKEILLLLRNATDLDFTGLFYGIWEITIGTKSLSETISYGQMQTALISAILAFGGISTAIQVQSQIKDTDLTLHRYLPYKGVQSIFAFLLGMFLPIKKQAVSVSGQIPTATPPDLSNYPYPLWSLGILFLMILSLVLLRILHWKRTRVSLH